MPLYLYCDLELHEQYSPNLTDATPDDVLAVLLDQHRHQCTYDPEADAEVVLMRESTIADWRQACDLVGWKTLAKAMNAAWEVEIPLAVWHSVLEPAAAHTLGEVCDLLARHAKLPRIRPAKLFGTQCVTAGVFLTIRSYLASAGADVSDLAPSTPLAQYTRQYAGVFLGPISRLAPGVLPAVKIRTPIYDACVLIFIASLLGSMLGHLFRIYAVTILSVLAAIFAYLSICVAARFVQPASVEFHGLETFRDLCMALAVRVRT